MTKPDLPVEGTIQDRLIDKDRLIDLTGNL